MTKARTHSTFAILKRACWLQASSQQELQAFAKERLPPYQVPRSVKLVDAIPRNAMGKVNKKELAKTLRF